MNRRRHPCIYNLELFFGALLLCMTDVPVFFQRFFATIPAHFFLYYYRQVMYTFSAAFFISREVFS